MSVRCQTEVPVSLSICNGGEIELAAEVEFSYSPAVPARGPTYDCGGEPPESESFDEVTVIALRDKENRLLTPPDWLRDWIAQNIDADDLRDAVPDGPDPDEAYERKREAKWDPWAAE